jgi:hypothetical protein
MTTRPPFDDILTDWLEDGPADAPDQTLETVLAAFPSIPQRRAALRVPWRFAPMNGYVRVLAALAAVVVLAVIGVNLVPRTGGVGSGGGPPSTPVPTATASPTPSPTPAPTLPQSGQLAPGTYRSNFMAFTLPAGWSAFEGWAALRGNGDPPNGMAVAADVNFATVYNDPCHWQTTAASVGPTVDNLVAALVAQKRGSKVTAVDVTIDGFRGKQIDLMVPLNVTVSACDGGQYKSWTDSGGGDRYNQGPGQHDLLDILDMNGKTVAIQRSFFPANTAGDLAELQAIVDSVKIAP